jgi:hypothetical protein
MYDGPTTEVKRGISEIDAEPHDRTQFPGNKSSSEVDGLERFINEVSYSNRFVFTVYDWPIDAGRLTIPQKLTAIGNQILPFMNSRGWNLSHDPQYETSASSAVYVLPMSRGNVSGHVRIIDFFHPNQHFKRHGKSCSIVIVFQPTRYAPPTCTRCGGKVI